MENGNSVEGLLVGMSFFWASQMVLVAKNLCANAGDLRDKVRFLDQEDSLEMEMATHSTILAWRIPWTEGLGAHD